jgi:acyl carrier protein phosphodiesterase
MKTLYTIIALIFFNCCGFSQSGKIKIDVLGKGEYVTDSIAFRVQNAAAGTLKYFISIEVYTEDQWQELYANIYEFDRDVVQNYSLAPAKAQTFHYSIFNIHKDYQELYNKQRFRLVINRLYEGTSRNMEKTVSNSFKIKWF